MGSRLRYSIPRERRQALQQGYNLLCEYLNYDDQTKHYVRPLLDGAFVDPFFQEYCQDYLEASSTSVIEDINYNELLSWMRNSDAFAQSRYSAEARSGGWSGSKKGWTALDHATRFVVRVLSYSWKNKGEWDSGHFEYPSGNGADNSSGIDESDRELHQVWAVLRYLQAEWEAANLEAWEMDPEFAKEPNTSRL